MREDGQLWRPAEGAASATPGSETRRGTRALLLIELANFASLRRALGVSAAELVALHVAERAAAALPEVQVTTVGRNLVECRLLVPNREALDAAVATLRSSAEQPLTVNGTDHALRLRVGAALADGSADELALVEAAEASLAQGHKQDADKAVTAVAPRPTASETELLDAAARDELFVQYQPKLHLRRKAINSVEALLRWRHPRRGLVMPNEFIPAAERSGAIKAMTLWTLKRVIADQRVLVANGFDLPVFVNIAGVLLSDRDFVAAACALVRESGAKLGFEITETSVIREPELAIHHLQQLADIGVAITIDDYGAGLSSLAYLKQLPARELKIDKLFVTQLSSSHRDPLIVRSTIDLAHALEMEVVAEGVETSTSLALLTVMGCDMVQGFLISRPLALEALLAFLREERHRDIVENARSPLERLTAVRARA